jgi:Helicase conserved C-terminal domain
VSDVEKFVGWLGDQVVADATGSVVDWLAEAPADRLWLGRLSPEEAAWRQGFDERSERLDPSSLGFRLVTGGAARSARAKCRWVTWEPAGEHRDDGWRKQSRVDVEVDVPLDPAVALGEVVELEEPFAAALAAAGDTRRRLRIDVIRSEHEGRAEFTVTLVNGTDEPEPRERFDPNVYEVEFELEVPDLFPYELTALPDAFRYDRRLPGYGLNCGVDFDGTTLRALDVVAATQPRPVFWDAELGDPPDLRFETLANDPLPVVEQLRAAADEWGQRHWSAPALRARYDAGEWTEEMLAAAEEESGKYADEIGRIQSGVETLRADDSALRAFRLMNEAMLHTARRHGYDAWRPFQLGYILAVLEGIVDPSSEERRFVDTLWFATGGGKTETYLGVIVFACLLDRMRGREYGITAWSRFPLRMLSLQQTQRFADALAGAELVRQKYELGGEPFRLGFFVGAGATPNRIDPDPQDPEAPDPTDPEMPEQFRILLLCPFCGEDSIEMSFSERYWTLEHTCSNDQCPWAGPLPFYVVDDEIYRFLPSVVVGTLDKAALLAMQASMRGFFGAPLGFCAGERHGFTYAPRSSRRSGCLVPGCTHRRQTLPQDEHLFAPTILAQDELHLLRDSLGAVDSHYETLLQHLIAACAGAPPKLIASSATLAGYEKQVNALYRRPGRVFPLPGPDEGMSFWTQAGDSLLRRYLGLAPRGVTNDFASDRISTTVQTTVRRAVADPSAVAAETGIDPTALEFLVSTYGVGVVYGNTLPDVDAAARSFQTQIPLEPINWATLTGRTPLDEVRAVLDKLENDPTKPFDDRLHLIAASSMMSHGVDVPRLNVLTMLGLPLATAEFIQTTARIGRRSPGLVFVLHRMARERDAGILRVFETFVRHGDRFVDPVPVTRRSKRVLELTFGGALEARRLGIHEPRVVQRGGRPLTTIERLREFVATGGFDAEAEIEALVSAFAFDPDEDAHLISALQEWLAATLDELMDDTVDARWPSDLIVTGPPMRSLRDVESQVDVYSVVPTRRRRART